MTMSLTITNHGGETIEVITDNNAAPVTLKSRCSNLYVASESIQIRPAPMTSATADSLPKPILDDPATWPTLPDDSGSDILPPTTP